MVEFEMSNRHTGIPCIGRYVDKPSFKIHFYPIMTYAVLLCRLCEPFLDDHCIYLKKILEHKMRWLVI